MDDMIFLGVFLNDFSSFVFTELDHDLSSAILIGCDVSCFSFVSKMVFKDSNF